MTDTPSRCGTRCAGLYAEDFSAAVVSTQDFIDQERIGILGICGWCGKALNAQRIQDYKDIIPFQKVQSFSRPI